MPVVWGGIAGIRLRTVAVLTEVAFDEVYTGQKTFADIHALMLDTGFDLARLAT